jgi:hypothetical protein
MAISAPDRPLPPIKVSVTEPTVICELAAPMNVAGRLSQSLPTANRPIRVDECLGLPSLRRFNLLYGRPLSSEP